MINRQRLGPCCLGVAAREHKHWLRDKRAEACESYYGLLAEARNAVLPPNGEEDGEETAQRAGDLLAARMIDCGARLELYVSKSMLEQEIFSALSSFRAVWAAKYSNTHEEFWLRCDTFFNDSFSVQERMRVELGVDRQTFRTRFKHIPKSSLTRAQKKELGM